IFLHALERLGTDQAPLPGNLLALSAYVFGEGRFTILDGSNGSSWGFGKPNNFTVDPQHAQKFLTTSLNVLLRVADTSATQLPDGAARLSTAFYAAKVLEPKMASYHPALQDQWLAVTSRLAALNAEGSGPSILKAV